MNILTRINDIIALARQEAATAEPCVAPPAAAVLLAASPGAGEERAAPDRERAAPAPALPPHNL